MKNRPFRSLSLLLLLSSVYFSSSDRIPSSHAKLTVKESLSLHHRGFTSEIRTPSKQGITDKDTSDINEISLRGGAKKSAPMRSPLVQDLLHRLKIGFYFGLWYALNIIYNILNKKLLNTCPAPMTLGSIQLGVGALYACALWWTKLRARPVLTTAGQNALRQVGLWHATGQLASMVSLGAGAISFTHIVKALEPFFSAVVSALVFGKWMRPTVYATLIPVVAGVGYACLKERAFSWLAFWTAMLSNLAFALRAVLSKTAMTVTRGKSIGTNLTAPNVFGLVTLSSFVLSIPMALVGEGATFRATWQKALESQSQQQLVRSIVISGLFHYLNNEVMYLALGQVHPITLAVGNTMKRVFIMVASVIAFRNQISLQAGIGSGVGLCGVLLYSLTKQYYEKLDAVESKNKKRSKKKKP